jgi:tRNA pseudouridine55 synthase
MRTPPGLHGFLAIDKPAGWTSHDVVARVRRVAGQREVGHGGTLDPMATGLLAVGLGQATRLLEFLASGTKAYEATVRFGAATDTYDAEGSVTEEAPWQQIQPVDLARALVRFTGTIEQRPPLYSAIKRAGEPLYRLARRGEAVEVEPRMVTIARLELRRFEPPDAALYVECGGGTYVRSIAHDLGLALGSRAHLVALRRVRAGMLDIHDAADLASINTREHIADRLLAIDLPVWTLPAVILGDSHAADVCQGRRLPRSADTVALCRAYGSDGTFLALLESDAEGDQTGYWLPRKVFMSRSAREKGTK